MWHGQLHDIAPRSGEHVEEDLRSVTAEVTAVSIMQIGTADATGAGKAQPAKPHRVEPQRSNRTEHCALRDQRGPSAWAAAMCFEHSRHSKILGEIC